MKPSLLDVNVLLALAWPNHQDHAAAHRWFNSQNQHGWATCAVTELGFVRLSSNPAYTSSTVSPSQASALLLQWTQHRKHQFWDSPPADDAQIFKAALGHQQVMDAWLVHTAAENRGRLVTFDHALAAHTKDTGLVEVLGRK